MFPVQWMYWWSVENKEDEDRFMPRSVMQLTKPNLEFRDISLRLNVTFNLSFKIILKLKLMVTIFFFLLLFSHMYVLDSNHRDNISVIQTL
jgi:hypothetical protein